MPIALALDQRNAYPYIGRSMVMFDQSKRLSEPLRWTRGGRIAVIAAGACALATVIVAAAFALTSGPTTRPGCITLTFASTVGGATIHYCGADARTRCATPSTVPMRATAVADACRKAGLPVGS